jgi:hypothetical protein
LGLNSRHGGQTVGGEGLQPGEIVTVVPVGLAGFVEELEVSVTVSVYQEILLITQQWK